jgi:hypothetical protein
MPANLTKSIFTTLLAVHGFAHAATDSVNSESDPLESDQAPFENVVDPQSNSPRWALALSVGRGWTSRDTFSTSQTAVVSRSFSNDALALVPRVGVWRESDQPDQATYSSASAGGNASWAPTDEQELSLDGVWTTQEGPDSWEVTADWSYDRDLMDWLGLQAGVWTGWSKDQRGTLGASLDASLTGGAFALSAGGTYTRRFESYYNVYGDDKSSYINAYGWSSSAFFTRGKWSTGPSWSGETWTANTSGIPPALKGSKGTLATKLAQKAAKVPASGVVINQSLGWSTTWKVFPGMRLIFGLVQNFGSSKTTTNAKNSNVQAAISRQGQDPTNADDSFGASLGYRFSW